jgi:hypothetical protein
MSKSSKGVIVTTSAIPATGNPSAVVETDAKGHVGLVVLASIAAGLVLGLLFVIVAFAGADEALIIGAGLVALGAGFTLLALASTRYTNQRQHWALAPGAACGLGGLLLIALSPVITLFRSPAGSGRSFF